MLETTNIDFKLLLTVSTLRGGEEHEAFPFYHTLQIKVLNH